VVEHLRGGLGAAHNTARLIQEIATGLSKHDAASTRSNSFMP
jgi:hypothetical protein